MSGYGSIKYIGKDHIIPKNDPYTALLFFDKNVAINPPKIAKGTISIKLFIKDVTGRFHVNKLTIIIEMIIDITG